jgi:radical SAM protein with 4Fe4S-binding SPASM domain
MSWITKDLNERTRRYAAAERAHPYALSLLMSNERHADRVLARTRNWMSVRDAEALRPDEVPGLPYHAVLDPSSVCNLRCPLCVQATDPDGRRRGLVDVDRFRALLRQMAPHVIRLDLFNWGEPLLHPAFADLSGMATAESVYVRTSSHMSHERAISWDAIVASGIKYVVASIDGATQPTYERYRVGGKLDIALQNLAALLTARRQAATSLPIVEWQYLVNKYNDHEVNAAERLARDLGVDIFRCGGARGRMSLKTLVSSADVYASGAQYLVDPDHVFSEYDDGGAKRRIGEAAGCRWLWGKIALQSDGGITPCWNGWFARHDLANWHETPLASLWNSAAYRERRQSVRQGGCASGTTQCDTCAFHRNYVPTPDHDAEPIPDRAAIDELLDVLASIGHTAAPNIRDAVHEGMCGAVGRGKVA